MTTKISSILFPIDFSHRSVLAAQHVKIWVDGYGAVLNTLHILDAKALGYSPERRDDFLYNELPNLIVKRTADMKYFSDQYFGEYVARLLPRNHQNLGPRSSMSSTGPLRNRMDPLRTCRPSLTSSLWWRKHMSCSEAQQRVLEVRRRYHRNQ